MKWISVKENPPNLEEMLVVCSTCKHVHVVFFNGPGYIIYEACCEDGPYFHGQDVDFEWYMPLPELPKQDS